MAHSRLWLGRRCWFALLLCSVEKDGSRVGDAQSRWVARTHTMLWSLLLARSFFLSGLPIWLELIQCAVLLIVSFAAMAQSRFNGSFAFPDR